MFNNKKNVASSIDTLIGESCVIEGNLTTKTSIKIDGEINGQVVAEGILIVSETGQINGDVSSNELVVFGSLHGNVDTEMLHLQPTAKIYGDINTKILNIEPGAMYQGVVSMKDVNGANNQIEQQPIVSSVTKVDD